VANNEHIEPARIIGFDVFERGKLSCRFIITLSDHEFSVFSSSKVSLRKISTKSRSDKCVHCEAKVELDKLKEFVTCKGCEELACHNQKCSDFVFGLDVWECARCKKNR
jgi:hypothetical protein